jgi:hypothetical protein
MRPKPLFDELTKRVHDLISFGEQQEAAGFVDAAQSIYRACVVLAVSALDAYMHERAAEVFTTAVQTPEAAHSIATYLSSNINQLHPPGVASIVRYRLSFKTLVAPNAIDQVIQASGSDPKQVWQAIGMALGSRESRLRNMLDLQVDRRNQIAHEADWDPARLAFRRISAVDVRDCIDCIEKAVNGIDGHW